MHGVVTDQYALALSERRAASRLRELRSFSPLNAVEVMDGSRRLLNFCGNDYLGLAHHPEIIARAVDFAERYGAGSAASRLISGNIDAYDAIEEKLARLKKSECALIFASGFQTNATALPALACGATLIVADRLCHSSLLHGVKSSGKKFLRFKHNDLEDLTLRLSNSPLGPEAARWIVTESVFSMDGDVADVGGLRRLASESKASLYVDEAHACGVFGDNGMGLFDADQDHVTVMGTFSKGLGAFGGYIACSKTIRDYLLNFCPGLIYSTALPPAVLGAIDAALDIVPQMKAERRRLMRMAEFVRSSLRDLGFDTGLSSSQIVPVIVGSDRKALSLAEHLDRCGILARAIRPPTVPDGVSRVRLSLSAAHTDEQINSLLLAMRSWNATDL